jgi:ABC-type glycerol-3-phosphate transport system substrate-binding protein
MSKKTIATFSLLLLTLTLFPGCFLKKTTDTTTETDTEEIELVYYRLFDDSDVFAPIIQQYESDNPNVTITYKKFTDPDEYLNLIINELAEGEGPDLFSMNNTWFTEHRKKLSPAPITLVTTEDFESTFVDVASQDLILQDETGTDRVYGIPLYVDTLALYYNEDQFEDAIPSRGEPATTWSELQEDVFKLTKADNSFERFEVAGIAMGRSDNILRAVDILYLLMIQFGSVFYDSTYSEATFADAQGASTTGLYFPAAEALDFFTSFSLPSSKYYSWNAYLADADSDEKEIETFAKGKVSMIIGYSYVYEQILDQIEELNDSGESAIDSAAVKVAEIPQVEDPETSTEKRDTYASYFAETVSRTSEYPEEAWEFLTYLANAENLQHYHDETHRPTSRRDLIEEQADEAIYGIFVNQIGFAESFPVADFQAYETIFEGVIEAVLDTEDSQEVMNAAQSAVNAYIPEGGLFPVTVSETTE